MSRFFIDRPILAWVISILIMMAGVLALGKLPVAQYPDIASPLITITASYPDAAREKSAAKSEINQQQFYYTI